MTLPGGLDWQGATSQGVRFIGELAVDTVGSQSIDVSSLIGPQDQALLFYWVAAGPFTGLPLGIIAQTNAPPIFFSGHTQVPDGGQAILQFAGQLVLGVSSNHGATILVDNIGPGPIHVAGTLYTFALTGPPFTLPVIRRGLIGQGLTTGTVNAAAAGTTAILAAPSAGLYYRIKHLSAFTLAAPAAAARVSWLRTDLASVMMSKPFAAAANQEWNESHDFEWDFGLSLTNNTSVVVTCGVVYELWQA